MFAQFIKKCARGIDYVKKLKYCARRSTQGAGLMRILLVEDNQIALRMMRGVLQTLGHTVTTFEDGLNAIQVRHADYDLILLDLGLPGLDGCDVARCIRDIHHTAVIIAVTSEGESAREKCMRAGFNDVYTKPRTVKEINIILDAWGTQQREVGQWRKKKSV